MDRFLLISMLYIVQLDCYSSLLSILNWSRAGYPARGRHLPDNIPFLLYLGELDRAIVVVASLCCPSCSFLGFYSSITTIGDRNSDCQYYWTGLGNFYVISQSKKLPFYSQLLSGIFKTQLFQRCIWENLNVPVESQCCMFGS